MSKKKAGRKRIGQPISITVTPQQRKWLEAQIPPGGTLTEAIRAIFQKAMGA